ncbi:cation diffusion facilitator family transporter [Aestuariibacter halophilus]|uniref:Cation diffusion facilitator family transporter n=1 Tax=Fluctibacter halophilus TaxID=226011 RepID=A0ABS8G5Q4_9ALTE|nr:cation diffusion facilitator family transporter [Aestuariibacter halophilus]MCC2615912.1 cation diffusion facilitator family transporter [Aestuariibacter halophilus]
MSRQVKRVLIIEGSVNAMLALVKFVVGLITGSAALVADALHSLTDLVNNVFAWLAVNLAAQPADDDHPYGHQKFESLAVFGLAVLLSVVAIEVFINALKRIGEPVEQNLPGLIILVLALGVNLSLSLWEQRWAKRLDSSLLSADASHTFSDVLTSVAVLIGWQLAAMGYYWLDTVFATVVSVLILILAYRLFMRAIPTLVDQQLDNHQRVSDTVSAVEEVQSVRQLRARKQGKGYVADITVGVDPQLSVEQAHGIADEIERTLAERFNIFDVTVHIEPER